MVTFFVNNVVNNVVVLLQRVSDLLLLRMTGSVHTVVDHVVHTITSTTTMFTATKAVGVVLLQEGTTIPMIIVMLMKITTKGTTTTTKGTTTKITTTKITTTKGTTCWSTAMFHHCRRRMVTTTCRRTCCTHTTTTLLLLLT